MLYLLLLVILSTSVAVADEVPIRQHTEAIQQSSPADRYKFYQFRSRAYAKQNMLQEALADLNASINLNPTVSAHLERGQILMKLGRYQEAVTDLDLVVKDRPDDLELYRLRGKACFESGLYERALGDANRVLAKTPDDAGSRLIVMESTTALTPGKVIVMKSSYVPRRQLAPIAAPAKGRGTPAAKKSDIPPKRRGAPAVRKTNITRAVTVRKS